MTFGRLLLWLALLLGILFQLFLSGEWGEEMYGYIFTGALLLLALFLVSTGGKPAKRKRRSSKPASRSGEAASADEESYDLPEAVHEDEDGGSRRDRKVAAQQNDDSDVDAESDDEEVVIQIEEEDVEEEVHVAEEFVVDVTAEQAEEADIEDVVEKRRGHRAEIKRRIEERRRGQLAEIRASAARMWSKHDEGEDLLSVLSSAGHGLTVIDEPEQVEPGHPYGATYVRIDDARIMKVRVPLDVGFISASEPEVEVELDALPPPPDGLPLPPPPGEMPLPPPPMPSQSRLDAMRDEIGE